MLELIINSHCSDPTSSKTNIIEQVELKKTPIKSSLQLQEQGF